jgi:hypothetical protein
MKQTKDVGHAHPATNNELAIPIEGDHLKAAQAAAKQLPADFEFKAAEKSAKHHFTKYRETRRLSNEERWQATQAAFEIYAATADNAELQQRLKSRCIRKGLTLKKADLAIAVIRYYSDYDTPEPVNRYANVLREAAYRNIPPNKLAAYLRKKGQGIDRLHKAYQARQNLAAAKMGKARDDSDDGERTAAKGKSRKPDGGKHRPKTDDLIITWAGETGKFKPRTRLLVWIEIIDDNGGKVVGLLGRRRKNIALPKRRRPQSERRSLSRKLNGVTSSR